MDATVSMADNSGYTAAEEKVNKEKAAKNLLGFSIVSMIMMFAGLTSAVIVSKGGNFWVNARLPIAFWISSGLIVASSLTMLMARQAMAKNKTSLAKPLLMFTLLLGISFGVCQFAGYKQFVDNGYFFTSRIMDDEGNFIPKGEYGKDFTVSWRGEVLKYESGMFFSSTGPLSEQAKLKLLYTRNNASSFIYMLSFLHLLHMVGGIIYLLVVTIMAYRMRFSSSNYVKIKLINTYWHFLGILWIYLFVFLQYIH